VRHPLTVRLPESERARLEAYAERTGQPVNRVVVDPHGPRSRHAAGQVQIHVTATPALAPSELARRVRDLSQRVQRGELG
jgi:predicted DNA-binding protein